jgi:hypothetical protein
LTLASHENLAHDDVLDFFGLHAGTLESCLNRKTTKVCCTK